MKWVTQKTKLLRQLSQVCIVTASGWNVCLALLCMAWSYTAKCWSYSLTLDSQNERKEDAAGASFLVVSQHRLSKQKVFLVWRATEMALTGSERLRVQSVASALQAGIGCVESARKRKQPVKATTAAARFPHPGALVEGNYPVFCVFIQLFCSCFSGTYTFPTLILHDLNSIPLWKVITEFTQHTFHKSTLQKAWDTFVYLPATEKVVSDSFKLLQIKTSNVLLIIGEI